MKILIICAHPDDETIGMGGTLKKISKNNEVSILFISEGVTGRRDKGFKSNPRYEVSEKIKKEMLKDIEIRKKHAKNALGILGIKNMKFLDLPNMELDQIPLLKITKEIEKEIYKIKPEVVFTHHYNDLNQDHRIVYEATVTATRPIPGSTVNLLCSFEIPASTDWRKPYKFNPNLFVDITKEIEIKIKALKSYHYEIRKNPHPRSEIMTKVIAQRWGSLSNNYFAEAFEIIMLRTKNMKNLGF